MSTQHPPSRTDSRDQNGSLTDRVRSLRLQNQSKPQGQSSSLPWLLCGLLAVSSAVFGYQAFKYSKDKGEANGTPAEEKKAPDDPSLLGEEKIASSGDVALEAKGYVICRHRIQVSPRVSGIIQNLYVEEGMKVKKGDVLAQLETVDYQSDYLQAKHAVEAAKQRWLESQSFRPEEIAQAKAELAEAQAQFEQKRLDLIRVQRLIDIRAQAQSDFELAKSEKEMVERRVKRLQSVLEMRQAGPRKETRLAAEAELKRAEAELVKAKWRLDSCTVKAPITGTILTKSAEEGNIVNPAALNVSVSLCEMADLSDLEVDLSVQERDIANVEEGQECIIMPEAFVKDDTFRKTHPHGYDGFVSRLMPVADRAKGAISVRVKINIPKDEAGVYLKPDMSARVTFKKKQKKAEK